MQLKIYKDHHGLSDAASDEIMDLIKNKPAAVLCLASGDTPPADLPVAGSKIKKRKNGPIAFYFYRPG